MISIKREGAKVVLSIEVVIPLEATRIFYFNWQCDSDWVAGLLARHLQVTLGDAIKKMRKEEYEKGWKDAKAHNRKEDWFSDKL